MRAISQRKIVQHGVGVERASLGEMQKVAVLGTVLELPNGNIMYGFVRLEGGVDAVVWRRVIKESGQAKLILKGSQVECIVRYGNQDKPRVTSVKLLT